MFPFIFVAQNLPSPCCFFFYLHIYLVSVKSFTPALTPTWTATTADSELNAQLGCHTSSRPTLIIRIPKKTATVFVYNTQTWFERWHTRKQVYTHAHTYTYTIYHAVWFTIVHLKFNRISPIYFCYKNFDFNYKKKLNWTDICR